MLDLREISSKTNTIPPIIPRFYDISFEKIDQKAYYDMDEFIIRFIDLKQYRCADKGIFRRP